MKARIERLERKIGQPEWRCVTVQEIAPGVYVHSIHGYPVNINEYDHVIVIQVVQADD